MSNDLLEQQFNLLKRGRFQEALLLTKKLESLYPENLFLKFNKGYLLLSQGDFYNGYQLLEYGRSLKLYGSEKLKTNSPIWDASDLENKTLLVNLEGSVSDAILYSRIALNFLKQNTKIIYCCDERFHSVFSRIPGVYSCISPDKINNISFDFWLPSYSSSWIFYKNYSDINFSSYIFADNNSKDVWQKILNSKKKGKLGVAFSENIPELKDKTKFEVHRLFKYSEMFSAYEWYHISPYVSIDLANNLPIKDISKLLISLEDIIACIDHLDVIITECNEIAHIASAMGKYVIIFTPALAYHTWIYGGKHSPWFGPKSFICRQDSNLDWDQAFLSLDDALGSISMKNNII